MDFAIFTILGDRGNLLHTQISFFHIQLIINPILNKKNQHLDVFLSIFTAFTILGGRGNFWSPGRPYPNLAEDTAVCAPVKFDYFGQFRIFEGLWEFLDYLAQPFLRYLITISAALALQRSVGNFLSWQLGHGCLCSFFKLRHIPDDAGNGTGQLPAL